MATVIRPGDTPSSPTNPANPSNLPRVTEATRVPMNVPRLKLQTSEIPGYKLHWIHESNLARAYRAGYEFVEDDETEINNTLVGADNLANGNRGLGSRISMPAGDLLEGTSRTANLYLMKLRKEWADRDTQELAQVNDRIAEALRGGNAPGPNGASSGESPSDRTKRYLKAGQDLFYPKK